MNDFLDILSLTAKQYFCLVRGVQLFTGMCVLPTVDRVRLGEQIHRISTGASLRAAE